MTVYRIRNWAQHFEKAQSRVVRTPTWVSIPNKHDGKGFRRIMALADGMVVYAAWVLIVQVASKCPERGLLADSDGPMTADDISHKTGAPVEAIERAFNVLCEKGIAWIERLDTDSTLIDSMSALCPTGQDRTEQDSTGQDIPPSEGSSEPPKRGSEQPPVETDADSILSFPVVGQGPTEWSLKRKNLDELRAAYPGVDVLGECRKARLWCLNNPARRKTPRGMTRFLSGWMERVQNRSRAGPGKPLPFSGLQAFAQKHEAKNGSPGISGNHGVPGSGVGDLEAGR